MSLNTGRQGMWAFEKLRGSENYKSWSRSIKAALRFDGYWHVLEEDNMPIEPKDQLDDTNGTTKRVTAKEKTDWATELSTWKDHNNKATLLIINSCKETIAAAIEDEEVALEIWSALERLYMDSGFTSRHTVFQNLTQTTLADCNGSVNDYVTNLIQSHKELNRMGSKIEDWIVISCLLNNLGGRFKDFVHRIIISTAKPAVSNLVLSDVIGALHEEDRLSKQEVKQAALLAQHKKRTL